MSTSRRIQRAEKELKAVIANYLLMGIKEPLKGIVSVSRVMAAKDLRSAKVFISVLGSPEDQSQSLEAISSRHGDVQREVSHRLRMKFCPKLRFILDHGMDESFKIEQILQELKTGSVSS